MADALISPAVGGTMWAISAGLIAWCARKVRHSLDARMIPLMGVLGAFVFAAQMINFSIPFTGSSGHIGGGLILAILLGPWAAFLTISSVLTIQALFFADGGLLALGCNIFNLGVFPAFVAYPIFYKSIAWDAKSGPRLWVGAMLAGIAGLQMGAFGVVMETTMSGMSDLPFETFVLVMQPIHLAIGVVEGLVTAAVVSFVFKARPVTMIEPAAASLEARGLRRVVIGLLIVTVAVGGGLSWFASTRPDGLEWSISKVSGNEELESPKAGIHGRVAKIGEKTAVMPGYGFKPVETAVAVPLAKEESARWPAVSAGKSVAGLTGGLLTLVLALLIGYALRRRGSVKHGERAGRCL